MIAMIVKLHGLMENYDDFEFVFFVVVFRMIRMMITGN